MPLLEVQNLHKTYIIGKGIKTPALKGVDLAFEDREFTAIAGPSGSGKSSLLNLIGALDTPDAGRILYQEFDLSRFSNAQMAQFRLKHIGFIFQAYNLINTLTALENVEYIMLLQGTGIKERRKRAMDTLINVGLKGYFNRYPNEMSGGQQQRVAIARAIVSEPKVILADEPTANLDSKTAEALIDLMRRLNEDKGMTFIFSTHDQMIMNKAKRIIKIKDGMIEQ